MRMLALIADFLNCIQSTRITNFILEVAHPATAQASWGKGIQMTRQGKSVMREKYWLTPPELYKELDAQHRFDFDPCPCPRPEGYNSLILPWGNSNYVNPPFHRDDGVDGKGPTAFVRKAIEESKLGKSSVLTLPSQLYIVLLLDAGAQLSSLGRVKWVHADTGEPCKSPSPIIKAYLPGKPGTLGKGEV